MDNTKGWISLYRSIQEHYLWKDKPFSKGQAWIDLLLLANHTETKVLKDGRLQTFKRGTVNRSILELSSRWGWDRKKVKRFLEVLEADKMVTTKSTTHGTTITLINYDTFQACGTTNRTTNDTNDGQRVPINNNENNEYNFPKKKREVKINEQSNPLQRANYTTFFEDKS